MPTRYSRLVGRARHDAHGESRALRRRHRGAPGVVVLDPQHVKEGAARVANVDAIDVPRALERADQELPLRVHEGRRRGNERRKHRSHRDDRMAILEHRVVEADRVARKEPHLLLGRGDRGLPALPEGEPHQRQRDRDQEQHDDDAEMNPERLGPHLARWGFALRRRTLLLLLANVRLQLNSSQLLIFRRHHHDNGRG